MTSKVDHEFLDVLEEYFFVTYSKRLGRPGIFERMKLYNSGLFRKSLVTYKQNFNSQNVQLFIQVVEVDDQLNKLFPKEYERWKSMEGLIIISVAFIKESQKSRFFGLLSSKPQLTVLIKYDDGVYTELQGKEILSYAQSAGEGLEKELGMNVNYILEPVRT